MELCYVERERPLSSNNKRLQKYNRYQKLGRFIYECSVLRLESQNIQWTDLPSAKGDNGRGSNVIAKLQQWSEPSKNGRGQ